MPLTGTRKIVCVRESAGWYDKMALGMISDRTFEEQTGQMLMKDRDRLHRSARHILVIVF